MIHLLGTLFNTQKPSNEQNNHWLCIYTIFHFTKNININSSLSQNLHCSLNIGWLIVIYFCIFQLFKPQQRCCNFSYLCWGNRSLPLELGPVCGRISSGHILGLSGQRARGVLEIKQWHSYCQNTHLGLQDLKPCLVEIHWKMVVMKLLGYRISQHNSPIERQNFEVD